MQVTLATIRNRVRELGNYDNSARFSDSFMNDQINAALGELYELLSNCHQGYFDIETTLQTVAGQDYVNLPADFWRLRGLDVQGFQQWIELNQIGVQERNRYQLSARPGAFRIANGGTRGVIKLYPLPDAVYTLRLVYEPTRTPLSDDADVFEDFNGWVDYVVTGALLRCDEREQRPTQEREAKLERIKDRIFKAANERRGSEPEYLVPRQHRHGLWGGWE